MSTVWISTNGIVLRDLVPAPLRRLWVEQGACPGQDLYSLFSGHVRAHPQRSAVVDAAGPLSYRALQAQVAAVAAALAGEGLGPGHVVAIAVPGGSRAVAAELAVAAVGAVALPYPGRRGRRDVLHVLARSRASAVITDVDTPGRTDLLDLRPELPFLRTVFVFRAAGAVPAGCRLLDETATGERPAAEWHGPWVDPEGPARVLLSSGTESEPKLVAYSHNAMAGGRASYVAALHDGAEPMRNLVLVPLASSFGSLGTPVTLAALGGTLLLLERFDPAEALRMITRGRPTHVFGVPTMLRRLADHPPDPDEDLSSLRAVVSSGAPLRPDVARACARRFGHEVINVYGSADGVNCHTARVPGPGAGAGLPDPRVADIRIVDPDGREVPAGTEGEIWARGPMTPLCYVNAPELDARYRSPDGWVRTGDRGVLDAGGRLHVVDRIKQIIIRGGHNISPAEVERAITAHPALLDAICVPVADADLGERLCACVVPRPGTPPPDLAEINAFLADEQGLERPKLPELLLTVPELPVGATGKVCRQTLIQLAARAAVTSPASPATSPGTPALYRVDRTGGGQEGRIPHDVAHLGELGVGHPDREELVPQVTGVVDQQPGAR